jgi:hypothetical protein
MRTLRLVPVVAALCAAAMLTAPAGHAAPAKSTRAAKPAALKDSTIWTATTYASATSDAHKRVLAAGRQATITGEVVDVSCWLQLGKRGAAHVECGSKCIANGQPIGILDKTETLYILFPEEHHPRRDGDVDVRSKFALLLAKQVSVTGTVSKVRSVNALFVKADAFPDTLAAAK